MCLYNLFLCHGHTRRMPAVLGGISSWTEWHECLLRTCTGDTLGTFRCEHTLPCVCFLCGVRGGIHTKGSAFWLARIPGNASSEPWHNQILCE